METIKVTVSIPPEKREELLLIAQAWREGQQNPSWSASTLDHAAKEKFSQIRKKLDEKGWSEHGSELMKSVGDRVKGAYGAIVNPTVGENKPKE